MSFVDNTTAPPEALQARPLEIYRVVFRGRPLRTQLLPQESLGNSIELEIAAYLAELILPSCIDSDGSRRVRRAR